METSSPPGRGSEDQMVVNHFGAAGNLDEIIPRLARDRQAMQRIESAVRGLHTTHSLVLPHS
jgi:hypothetical protein